MTTTNTDTTRPSVRDIARAQLNLLLYNNGNFLITPDRDQIDKIAEIVITTIACGEKAIFFAAKGKTTHTKGILLTDRNVIITVNRCEYSYISMYYNEAVQEGEVWEISPLDYISLYEIATQVVQL